MKQFIKIRDDITDFKTRKYLGEFDHVLDPKDYEVGDYFRFNDTFYGDDVILSCIYVCVDVDSNRKENNLSKQKENSLNILKNFLKVRTPLLLKHMKHQYMES